MKAEKVDVVEANKKVLSAEQTGNLMEFLRLQRNYKRQLLTRLYKGAELKEIRKQLTEGPITMQWYGQTFPKDLLAMEHELTQQAYFEMLTEEERMKKALVNADYTEADFEALMKQNHYKKDFKKVELPDYLG
jgi:hypothetical protein